MVGVDDTRKNAMHRVFPWLKSFVMILECLKRAHQREKRKKEEEKMSKGDADEVEDKDLSFDHDSDVLHDLMQSLALSIYWRRRLLVILSVAAFYFGLIVLGYCFVIVTPMDRWRSLRLEVQKCALPTFESVCMCVYVCTCVCLHTHTLCTKYLHDPYECKERETHRQTEREGGGGGEREREIVCVCVCVSHTAI